ncbi:hypothetical protein D9M70_354710 [compost metagenome]
MPSARKMLISCGSRLSPWASWRLAWAASRRSWCSFWMSSSSSTVPGIGASGSLSSCARAWRNSTLARASNSLSARSTLSRLDLNSLTSFSSGVAISATGRMPAM